MRVITNFTIILFLQVITIFGIHGVTKANELTTVTMGDVKEQGEVFVIKIPQMKENIIRTFTVEKDYAGYVKKYQALHPSTPTGRFFVQYQNGKCSMQPIGKGKICSAPKVIAKFLNLPDSGLYNNHSYRKASEVLLADSKANMLASTVTRSQSILSTIRSASSQAVASGTPNYVGFPNQIEFDTHFEDNDDTDNIRCYQCESEPLITDELEPRRHKCVFCQDWFSNHIEFKTHFNDTHDRNFDDFFSKTSNCKEFTCYVCEKNFSMRSYLIAHMKVHDDKYLEHLCPICGHRVRTTGILTQHMKLHEKHTKICDTCDKVFPNQSRLRKHLLSHKT